VPLWDFGQHVPNVAKGSLLRIQPKPGMTGDGAAADDAK
jgi:hypothetical protein